MQVIPALGAEQIVAFCGGMFALLTGLGIDMTSAFLPGTGPQVLE